MSKKKIVEQTQNVVDIEAIKAHEVALKQRLTNFFNTVLEKARSIPVK